MAVSVSTSTVGPRPANDTMADCTALMRCRQHLFELGQRAHRGLLDSGDGATGGGAEPDRHGLLVVQEQRRKNSPGAQSVAAGCTVVECA
jgi:hypothetical protein